MRNQSGEILRDVADGETIQVTNHGQVKALIVPPSADTLADLVSRGQVREARQPPSSGPVRKSCGVSEGIALGAQNYVSCPG
jgi:antitoxin (DNA-binding transcriptional repressor) of toxin-antitoxin stability system